MSKWAEQARRFHASMTPEQKAAWRQRISEGTSSGMREWNANRTPEQKAATSRKQSDAQLARIFAPRSTGHRFRKGHNGMQTPNSPAIRALTKVHHSSIKRIMRDVVARDPDLIRDAIIEGLQAPPPRSFPYLALAAAYLDGKPTPDSNSDDPHADLAALSREELAELATHLAESLRAKPARPDPLVIDVTPEPGDV